MTDYLEDLDPQTFEVEEYLASLDERHGLPEGSAAKLLSEPQGRRSLTRLDPLLFGVLYFPHHICLRPEGADDSEDIDQDAKGPITLTEFHVKACRVARQWVDGKRHRDAFVAPRGVGKSTWMFLVIPMWALAHRHRRFSVAFADNSNQAMQHLITFKTELDTNPMIRKDYPGLCEAKRRSSGASVADRRDLYVSKNDQAFRAAGIDSSNLGLKVGNQRPDLIIFDDVEPDESNYSDYQKDQRLATIVNAVFPMNLKAAIVFTGTVLMPGSIMHDLVKVAMANWGDAMVRVAGVPDEPPSRLDDDWPAWVEEQSIRPHYYPALWWDDDDNPVSIWPRRWPVEEWLEGDPVPTYRTPAFQMAMQNNPRGRDDGWWTDETFVHGPLDPRPTRWILQIDPAVTDHKKSDYTGLVVAGYSPPRKRTPGRVEIAYADRVKLIGGPLRTRILKILNWYPQIKAVFIESNVGGDMWRQTLHGLPVPLYTRHSALPKEVRIAKALDWYQRPGKRVVHSGVCSKLELDMIAYPKIKHDDLVDAACLAVLRFLGTEQRKRLGVRSASYL